MVMCLFICAYKSHPNYPFIIAANRDEFHARPTLEAQFWNDEPSILAGRDLQAGGTWLGISRQGRIAAVTNYHEQTLNPRPPKSRGELVTDFLRTEILPQDYITNLVNKGHDYQGFTLVFGIVDALYSFSNRTDDYEELSPGIHGLSNRIFNDNSYKVRKGKESLRRLLSRADSISHDDLFSILGDRITADNTTKRLNGESGEKEIFYSPIFISGKKFGTRCSTVILVDSRGSVFFSEKTFSPEGSPTKTVKYEFSLSD